MAINRDNVVAAIELETQLLPHLANVSAMNYSSPESPAHIAHEAAKFRIIALQALLDSTDKKGGRWL